MISICFEITSTNVEITEAKQYTIKALERTHPTAACVKIEEIIEIIKKQNNAHLKP